MKLIKWDCLEEMDKLIEQWIKVDAIITDPPYWYIKVDKKIWLNYDSAVEFLWRYNIFSKKSI